MACCKNPREKEVWGQGEGNVRRSAILNRAEVK